MLITRRLYLNQNPPYIAKIVMTALVRWSEQSNPWLDRCELSLPG